MNIDENGNVEDDEYILQSFTLRASRRRLRRLKDIAAYNVGQCLAGESDVDHLILPQILQILVKNYINTYSGHYLKQIVMNELVINFNLWQ